MIRFWNSIVDMGPNRLQYKVLVNDLTPSHYYSAGNLCGNSLATRYIKKIGYHCAGHIRTDILERIDMHRVQDLLDRQTDLLWEGLHTARPLCASARAQHCLYYRWFIRPQDVPLYNGAPKLYSL
jgi:hypothetical protein